MLNWTSDFKCFESHGWVSWLGVGQEGLASSLFPSLFLLNGNSDPGGTTALGPALWSSPDGPWKQKHARVGRLNLATPETSGAC